MTKKKSYSGPVPFTPKGGIPNYTYGIPDNPCERLDGELTWRENVKPFTATLSFDGFSRGRSSANFTLVNATGAKFEMTASDLNGAIKSGQKIEGGQITGTFAVKKGGANYSIYLITPDSP